MNPPVLPLLFIPFLLLVGGLALFVGVRAQEDGDRAPVEYQVGKLEVVPPGLLIVKVWPTVATVELGGRLPYKAIGHYSNGSVVDISGQVHWVSFDPTIATISVTGVATALAIGQVDIGASLKPGY